MHVCEGATAGTRTGDPLATSAVLIENCALCNNDDMSTTQLLLQLSDQLALDFVVFLQLPEWNKQNDGFAASRYVDLLCSRYYKGPELLFNLKCISM